MKKLLLILALGGVFIACNNETKTDTPAAGDTATAATPAAPAPAPAAVKDSVMQFKDGKVMISLAGAWSPLTAAVTTSNGRVVNPNGEVTKGKVTRKMEEGMMIDKDGQLTDKDGKPMDTTGWE